MAVAKDALLHLPLRGLPIKDVRVQLKRRNYQTLNTRQTLTIDEYTYSPILRSTNMAQWVFDTDMVVHLIELINGLADSDSAAIYGPFSSFRKYCSNAHLLASPPFPSSGQQLLCRETRLNPTKVKTVSPPTQEWIFTLIMGGVDTSMYLN